MRAEKQQGRVFRRNEAKNAVFWALKNPSVLEGHIVKMKGLPLGLALSSDSYFSDLIVKNHEGSQGRNRIRQGYRQIVF